jgi:hypothetical protein
MITHYQEEVQTILGMINTYLLNKKLEMKERELGLSKSLEERNQEYETTRRLVKIFQCSEDKNIDFLIQELMDVIVLMKEIIYDYMYSYPKQENKARLIQDLLLCPHQIELNRLKRRKLEITNFNLHNMFYPDEEEEEEEEDDKEEDKEEEEEEDSDA